ncbi:MAG TPA: hypothetical protein VKH40_10730 [Alloacidobacterium sp.]|nr:hypothetical protein [Alloacidobacterium sp.]
MNRHLRHFLLLVDDSEAVGPNPITAKSPSRSLSASLAFISSEAAFRPLITRSQYHMDE